MSSDAFIQFLLAEAESAEQKARQLRAQAAALAAEAGLPASALHASGDGEYAPVDEHGIPKYKGKKRGRKPKPRKRQRKPGTPKRKHTAYTLFMKETYPIARQQRTGGVPSKVIITEVANMWKEISATEKATWKAKAQEVNQAEVDATARDLACEVDNFEEGEDDGTDYDGVDDVMGTKSGPSAV